MAEYNNIMMSAERAGGAVVRCVCHCVRFALECVANLEIFWHARAI